MMMLGVPLLLQAELLLGRVTDETGTGLAHVNLLLEETGEGSSSDSSGWFQIHTTRQGQGHLKVTHMGFTALRLSVEIPGSAPVLIVLSPTVIQLSEVIIQGTAVTDIRAPVTHSSLATEEISRKQGVQDIPLLLNLEPGVSVSNDGGSGFGDSQIRIRGFDEKRLQVLVNNIPINDPETKEVAWSSWSALPDATQAIQVQRGVGTALYGTGAIGGAINIVTQDALAQRATRFSYSAGAYGIHKLGVSFNSGMLPQDRSFVFKLGYLHGSSWRENSYHESLQYYFSMTQRIGSQQLFNLVFQGAPQFHTLSFAGLNAASYASPSQFVADSLRLNAYGQYAFGFGADFNGNVHTNSDALSSADRERDTRLLDALLFRSRIAAAPADQVGGFVLNQGRTSLNNNISHRPQLELHHNWYLDADSKLTTTAFISKGLDYSDDVYPAWYIPRAPDGHYDHDILTNGAYWGGNEVFEYRYYSDFLQLGILSAYATQQHGHEFSIGLEVRHWIARHAGEVLNIFSQDQVPVPIGSMVHPLMAGNLFYDFTTSKPQGTLFAHALWNWGDWQLMTNIQASLMRFRVQEQIPSNNNYPNHLDPAAVDLHGGSSWSGTATWDDDQDPGTPEVTVQYTLWDYRKGFQYLTPRLGLAYTPLPNFSLYTNLSLGIKEPEIKHFYGYGAPQDDLELEQTVDLEAGFRYRSQVQGVPFSVNLTGYNIDFDGKLMQITLPEKANTPGYDYAGHTYVAVGDARYQGLELAARLDLPRGFSYKITASASRNLWGEPQGTEGAQRLYANEAVAGLDYVDLNQNGLWDEGGAELALHRNFVSRYGARYDVGMPQLIWNNSLVYARGGNSGSLSLRYFRDLYVLENNAEILVGTGPDGLFFTEDDAYSATLPAALILDGQVIKVFHFSTFHLRASLQAQNLLDRAYWQRGDEFGVLPGAARTWLLGLSCDF